MDKRRLWMIGAVLVIGATIVLGWLLGISPKLSEVRAYDSEQQTTLAQNAAYEAQIAILKDRFENIDVLRDDLSEIQQAVPDAAEIPALVDEINSIAAASPVALSAIVVNDAQAFDPALLVVEDPAAAEPAAEGSSTSTPAPTEAADPAIAAEGAATTAAGVDPRITAANFVSIQISITVDGPYESVLEFVSGLQNGRRLVAVTAVSTTVPTVEGSVTGTITALVFVLLDQAAVPVPQ